MISLPPVYAEFGGKKYAIRNKGNWYDVYRCICAMNDDELDDQEKWFVAFRIFFPRSDEVNTEEYPKDVLFGEDISDVESAMKYISWFIDCGQSTNDDIPKKTNSSTGFSISFFQDMDLLVDSLNNAKDRDIRLTYEHWWTFVGDCASHNPTGLYKNVIEVRYKLQHNQKLDEFDKKILENHRNRVILRKHDDWLDGED
jgi:hypothetical protein